jgi:hypothetical protein
MNHWNELIVVINSKSKYSKAQRDHATILLKQLNTASSSRVKPEIELFLETLKEE